MFVLEHPSLLETNTDRSQEKVNRLEKLKDPKGRWDQAVWEWMWNAEKYTAWRTQTLQWEIQWSLVWKSARVSSGESNLRPRLIVKESDREAWKMMTLRLLKVDCERQTWVELAMQYRCSQRKLAALGLLGPKKHQPCDTQAWAGAPESRCVAVFPKK